MGNPGLSKLTSADLGPGRKLFDKSVKYFLVFFAGWAMCAFFYNVAAIPGLKDNSVAWYSATTDRFEGICRAFYGPKKVPTKDAGNR